eukprot:1453763-Rhodomonas_salina.1
MLRLLKKYRPARPPGSSRSTSKPRSTTAVPGGQYQLIRRQHCALQAATIRSKNSTTQRMIQELCAS